MPDLADPTDALQDYLGAHAGFGPLARAAALLHRDEPDCARCSSTTRSFPEPAGLFFEEVSR